MMVVPIKPASLQDLSDEAVLEEAAIRLQRQYFLEQGTSFLFGTFRFIFHDGVFQSVEDWPRHRRYVSPKKITGEKGQKR